jgi:catechol 2,3-dioxygenase-like lactoylglutathione lyase family enzyme
MALIGLDRVNIRTADLDWLCHFYEDVLGLAQGPRPNLNFNGAWLYCGGLAVVHLVELSE